MPELEDKLARATAEVDELHEAMREQEGAVRTSSRSQCSTCCATVRLAQKINIHVHCALTHATAGKHIDKAGIVKLRKTGRDMSASKMSPKPFDTSFAKPPTPTLKEFAAATATPVFKGPAGIGGHAEDLERTPRTWRPARASTPKASQGRASVSGSMLSSTTKKQRPPLHQLGPVS